MTNKISKEIVNKLNTLIEKLNIAHDISCKIISENINVFEECIKYFDGILDDGKISTNTYNVYILHYDLDNKLLVFFNKIHIYLYSILNCYYTAIKNNEKCVVPKFSEDIGCYMYETCKRFDNYMKGNIHNHEVNYIKLLREHLCTNADKIGQMKDKLLETYKHFFNIINTSDTFEHDIQKQNMEKLLDICENGIKDIIKTYVKYVCTIVLYHNIVFGNIEILLSDYYVDLYKFDDIDRLKMNEQVNKIDYKILESQTSADNKVHITGLDEKAIGIDNLKPKTSDGPNINIQKIIYSFNRSIDSNSPQLTYDMCKKCSDTLRNNIYTNYYYHFKFFVNYTYVVKIFENNHDKNTKKTGMRIIEQIIMNYFFLDNYIDNYDFNVKKYDTIDEYKLKYFKYKKKYMEK